MNSSRHLNFQFILLFISGLIFLNTTYARLKPVALEIKEKHEQNTRFLYYDLFSNPHELSDEKLKQVTSSGTTAIVIPGKLQSLVQRKDLAIALDVPFNGNSIIVELVSADIFTEDFSVVTAENKIIEYTPGVYYRGIIKGNPNSLAVFSFFNDRIYGTLSDDTNGNIVVGLLERPGNTTEYIIYSEKNLLVPNVNFCSTAERDVEKNQLQGIPPNPAFTATNKCVRLYYEVDNDIFVNNGSNVVNTTNWMTAVHNNVQTLFANDNITVALSQVYVWSTTDPFDGNDSGDQLDTFRITRTSFNGDAGQLVGHDGSYGGLAYLDELCTSFHYSYSDVNYTYNSVPTYSWTIMVITHEFGHVLGSPHTQSCSWPVGALDDCYATEGGCPPGPSPTNGGTIMSYCHLSAPGINFNNGFGPYPAGAIQNSVNNASCLGASCAVCPVPAHNACTTPSVLSISANCVYVAGNLCGATESIPPVTCNSRTAANGHDVWYQVTPAQTSMIINCQSGTSTDAVIALYSGSCGSLTLIDCSDQSAIGGLETITATSTPASTYFIRVYDYNGNTTGKDFAICVTQNCVAVTNNSCSSPTALTIGTSCSFITGELCSATQSLAPSTCSGYTSADAFDVWYTITPSQNNVKITCQSGIATDVILGVYSGACGSLNLIQCIDSTGPGGIEILNATLTSGNTYRVRVYDWSGNQNGTDFQLCAEYPCSGLNAPTGATAGTPSLCAGSNTTLNVSGTLSAGATWHWYLNSCGGISLDTGATINVSPALTTTYYVRAENGSCYSMCSNVGVAVIQIPSSATSVSASASSICAGDSTVLSANGILSPGASWMWYADSCGGTNIGSGDSLIDMPPDSTLFYVRAENGNCFSPCANTAISVLPPPNAPLPVQASSLIVCGGDSVVLSENGILAAGSSWRWYKDSCGGAIIDTGTTLTIIPPATTTYFVRGENANCNSICMNFTIIVNPLQAPPVITISNDTLSVPTAQAYLWYFSSNDSNFLPTGDTMQQISAGNGYYFVEVTDTNGCTTFSDTILYIDPTNVENPSENFSFTIFPNPAEDLITLKFENEFCCEIILKMFDATGRLIYEQKVNQSKNLTYSVKDFASGVYTFIAYTARGVYSRKVVKH